MLETVVTGSAGQTERRGEGQDLSGRVVEISADQVDRLASLGGAASSRMPPAVALSLDRSLQAQSGRLPRAGAFALTVEDRIVGAVAVADHITGAQLHWMGRDTDNDDVAQLLIDRACAWARDRGLTSLSASSAITTGRFDIWRSMPESGLVCCVSPVPQGFCAPQSQQGVEVVALSSGRSLGEEWRRLSEREREAISRAIEAKRGHVLVAHRGGEVQGGLVASCMFGQGIVARCFNTTERWDADVSAALVRHAMAWWSRRQASHASVVATAANIEFFRSHTMFNTGTTCEHRQIALF